MSLTLPKDLAAAVAFTVQIVIGAASFIVVFLAAVAIGAVVHHFEDLGLVPGWLSDSAKVVEIAIWIIDLAVFALFLLTELIKSVRRTWREWSSLRD